MNVLYTALYSKLQTTSAITSLLGGTTAIYALQAPEGATLPYIVFGRQSGIDENLSANRTKSILLFIRAYSKVSNAQAGSIDTQIDTALHLVPFSNVSGWTNFWLARETDLELVETQPSGLNVFMQGALYRVRLDSN